MKLYIAILMLALTGCASLPAPSLADKCAAVKSAEAFVRAGPDQWGNLALPGATSIATTFFADKPVYYVHFRAEVGDGYYVYIQQGEPAPPMLGHVIERMKFEPVSCD